jgi:hypothetical protein
MSRKNVQFSVRLSHNEEESARVSFEFNHVHQLFRSVANIHVERLSRRLRTHVNLLWYRMGERDLHCE